MAALNREAYDPGYVEELEKPVMRSLNVLFRQHWLYEKVELSPFSLMQLVPLSTLLNASLGRGRGMEAYRTNLREGSKHLESMADSGLIVLVPSAVEGSTDTLLGFGSVQQARDASIDEENDHRIYYFIHTDKKIIDSMLLSPRLSRLLLLAFTPRCGCTVPSFIRRVAKSTNLFIPKIIINF